MVSDYVSYLGKGQIPPKHISLVNSVTLNIKGSKYTINMVRGGPSSYMLRMNGSEIEAEIHTLRDRGLLMQLDRNNHVIYAEEEAAGIRLLIDGRTCLLQNPSKLVAETPCKLLRFLVQDGRHVDTDAPYAEVEVMKMCMPRLLPASGVIHFVMSKGQAMQVLECQVVIDSLTRESYGFAFVTMKTVEGTERCIKYLNSSVLEGCLITAENVPLYSFKSITSDCAKVQLCS